MNFFVKLIEILDADMKAPNMYGWFHIMFLILSIAFGVFLCLGKNAFDPRRVRRVILITAIVVTVLEIYKQFNFSFSVVDGKAVFDFQWYAFPWQFCSMPMYVGLLAGMTKKGRFHEAMVSFLATYALFAGTCVMFYPTTVFIDTIGINIQTMVCHGSMLSIGIYLLAGTYIKPSYKTTLKALPVFLSAVVIAMIGNEIAYRTGLLNSETFNMFFISPYCDPHLPVYSMIQGVVPFPYCVIIYVVGFTVAVTAVMYITIGIKTLVFKAKNGVTRKNTAAAAR